MPFQPGAYVALWGAEQDVQLARTMGFKWVYLAEAENKGDLGQTVQLYHGAGIQVCAALTVSSCAYDKSYQWYALDPRGRRIPAGEGRAFVCWNAPEWLSDVQKQMEMLIDSGVDGIFFRQPWVGGIPHEVGNGLLGFAGCHDARCRSAYAEAAGGAEIPKQVNTNDERSRRYLEWRANLAARRIEEWIAFGREQKPDLHIAVEGVDPLHHDAWVQYGIDLQRLGTLADRVMVEGDFARLGADGSLTQNAAVLAAAPHAGVILGAIKGRTLAANLAEARAIQGEAIPSAPDADDEAAVRMNRWIADHDEWLGQGKNCAPLGIYLPSMKFDWARCAPYVWAACQTVIQGGLPFRLVRDEDWSTLKTLIVPPGEIDGLDDRLTAWIGQGGHVIALNQKRPGSLIWSAYHPPRQSWVHWSAMRWLTYPVGGTLLYRTASRRPVERWMSVEGWMPPSRELLDAVGAELTPRVEIEGQGAVLFIMRRETTGEEQWHFVNYGDAPQRITVHAPEFVSGWVHSPQEAWRTRIFGHSLIITVDDYKVVRLLKQKAGN